MLKHLFLFIFIQNIAFVGQRHTFAIHTPRSLQATLDYCRFKVTDSTSILEVYISIIGNSVQYIKNYQDKYQGSIYVTILLSTAKDTIYFDKFNMLSPEIVDTNKPVFSFSTQKRIYLNNNNYNLSVSVKDNNAPTDSSFYLSLPLEIGYSNALLSVSDIQLLESYKKFVPDDPSASGNPGKQSGMKELKKNDYVKNDYQMINYNSSFFPKNIDKLKFYAEIYNADKILGTNEPFVVFYKVNDVNTNKQIKNTGRFSKQKAQSINPLLSEINITNLPSGNYYFMIEVKDRNNNSLASQKRFFQRSNPVEITEVEGGVVDGDFVETLHATSLLHDIETTSTFIENIDYEKICEYLMALRPVAQQNEIDLIAALVKSGDTLQQKKYMYYFWKKRSDLLKDEALDPTFNYAEMLWNDYLKRLKIAEKKYSSQNMKAYETDRGRVYLQYGEPNRIENEFTDHTNIKGDFAMISYEIWYFYKIQNQRNKIFVFVQNNKSDNNYILIHSTTKGEVYNPNWREEIKSKF